MARTRGAKSSSPSNRKKSLRKEPVLDSAPEPSQPKAIPPPVKPAPPKPPARRYLTRSGGRPLQKRPRVESSEPIDLTEQSPEPSPIPTPVSSPVPSPIPMPVPLPVPSPALQEKSQEPQAPLPEPQIPSETTLEEVIRRPMLPQPPIEGNLDCRAQPFHFELCFDLSAFRVRPELAQSFQLLRRLLCQILEHLGYPSEPQLEKKRICRESFTLDKWNNMTVYKVDQPEQPQPAARRASTRHIPEGITVAAPAIPRAPPATSASSQPSTSAEPRMAIPISEYRELCRALETLTASQSSLAQEMAAIRACQEQMLATQAQQAAILRQLQVHFDLPQAVEPSTDTPAEPHSHPLDSHPPEPQAPADAPTEEVDPSA
uniref:Uncharacterized protein n=1 Tax=Vitis vinifera TaxID=29760 RepID=A5ACV1_VITVI|nr:hypothetical protein VITISV_020523 [Vitis vinifera]